MAPKRDDDWASDLSSSAGRHQTRPRHENRSPGAQRAGLVLIADDNRDARELYGLYLSHVGFSVELVADGLEAVNTAMKLRPDVIVMDLTMPRLDGIEATRRLKASSRTRDIPSFSSLVISTKPLLEARETAAWTCSSPSPACPRI
jgi:CheY-like chemotaxis protein